MSGFPAIRVCANADNNFFSLKRGSVLSKSGSLACYVMLLSSVCISNVYSNSYCNVGSNSSIGTPASNNICTVTKDTFNPQYSDDKFGSAIVDGGTDALTLNGDLSKLSMGTTGIASIDELGNIDASVRGKAKLTVGSRNGVVHVIDAGGQSYSVNVYTNDSFSISDWGNSPVIKPQPVGDDQYVNATFGRAINGGHLVVDFDNFGGNNGRGSPKTTYLALKNSNLTSAEGPDSVVEWRSKNSFESRAYVLSKKSSISEIDIPIFPHSFTDFKGNTRQINTAQDLIAYNNELVAALTDPQYPSLKTQIDYDAAMNAAQPQFQKKQIISPDQGVTADDEVRKEQEYNRAIYATNGGKIIVKSGAQIDVQFDPTKDTGALVAEQGSTVEIEKGAIVSARGHSAVILHTDNMRNGKHTVGTNDGVINAGFRESNSHDTTIDSSEFYYGAAVEAYWGGTITNNGIINVATNRSTELELSYSNGLYLYGVGIGINNGVINLGVNNDGLKGRNIGVAIAGNFSEFTNTTTGTIYIGRAAQYNPETPEKVADTSNINNAEFFGIAATDNAKVTNNGKIIIGSKMQNAVAMAGLDTSANLKVVNNGSLIINGDVPGTLGTSGARNYGLLAINNGTSNQVENNGEIILNGSNGVGVYVLATTEAEHDAQVKLTANSHITVSSANQPDKLVRNYGVWVEGRWDKDHYARAIIDGSIKLTGDGAVGVYVRNGGVATITTSANPVFESGERQIGFYVYGANSKITNATQNMAVSTKGSTLFRLDGGADFLGQGEELKALGEKSVILEGAGRADDNTRSQILTNDAHLTANGKDSVAVLINGGAFGQISDKDHKDRQIYLGGDGAIGGIVDGRYHQINSSYTETEVTSTELVNYAKIDTGAENVTGFVTRNGGLLVNYGVINMTNGANATGIHVLQGGRLENHDNITISNGIGLHAEGIIGKDTSSNILNDASITVNDGRAGIYLEKNAFLNAMTSHGQINVAGTAHGVLLASDAKGIMLGTEKITVLQNSTGNGIENNITSSDRNYAAPIAFKNTTINVLGDGSGIRTGVGLVSQYTDENNATQSSKVTINIGSNGVGYDFRGAQLTDPVLNANTTIGNGYTINASGQATGLRTYTSGDVINYATVTMANDATGKAWLAGTTSKAENAGTLQSESSQALLVDLSNRPVSAATGTTFINSGKILATTRDDLAIKGSNQGDNFYFTNSSAEMRGLLQAGDGSDQLIWSAGKWEGGFDMGGGNEDHATIAGAVDTSNFKHAFAGSGYDNKLTLSNATVNGGSFSNASFSLRNNIQRSGIDLGDNWRFVELRDGTKLTLTDDLDGRNGLNIDVDNRSTLVINQNAYSGTHDNPTIYSSGNATETTGNVKLNNSGLIDMSVSGQGVYTDRLIVKGDYHSDHGSIRLNTDLSGDGAASDRLVIDGGKVTGTTTLYIDGAVGNMVSQTTKQEGIKLVDARNGATTGNDSFVIGSGWGRGYRRSDGIMAVAGSDTAYAYVLYRGSPRKAGDKDVYGDSEFASDWYLRSGQYVVDDKNDKGGNGNNGNGGNGNNGNGGNGNNGSGNGSSGSHNDNGNGGNNNSGNSSSNSHNNNGSAGNSDSGNGSSNSLINNSNDGNNGSGSGSENWNGSNNASSEKGKPVTSHKPFYGPSVPLYEAYPQVLLNLNQLPTLQQRVGTRFWNSNDGHNNNTCRDLDDQTPSEIENCGIWGRMEGSTGKVTPDHSPTEQNYKIDVLRMQAGVDGSLKENQYGTLIGSFSAHYGRAEAKIRSDDGHGKVETAGYGVGAAATWYGNNNTYIDLQSQVTWFDTDFNSKTYVQSDTKNENGFGYALSAEAGHKFDLAQQWTITPQAQLMFSSVDFDNFRDKLNTKVSLKDGDSLEGRAGVAFNQNHSWKTDTGDIQRLSLYGITNVYYEFLDGTKVDISGTRFRNENKAFKGGLGLGATYNWHHDTWSLYGEANVRSAFENVDNNYKFNGTIGLRAKF